MPFLLLITCEAVTKNVSGPAAALGIPVDETAGVQPWLLTLPTQ
jgi:hypothetical protein